MNAQRPHLLRSVRQIRGLMRLVSPVTSGEAIAAATTLHQGDSQNRARGLTRSPEHTGETGPRP